MRIKRVTELRKIADNRAVAHGYQRWCVGVSSHSRALNHTAYPRRFDLFPTEKPCDPSARLVYARFGLSPRAPPREGVRSPRRLPPHGAWAHTVAREHDPHRKSFGSSDGLSWLSHDEASSFCTADSTSLGPGEFLPSPSLSSFAVSQASTSHASHVQALCEQNSLQSHGRPTVTALTNVLQAHSPRTPRSAASSLVYSKRAAELRELRSAHVASLRSYMN